MGPVEITLLAVLAAAVVALIVALAFTASRNGRDSRSEMEEFSKRGLQLDNREQRLDEREDALRSRARELSAREELLEGAEAKQAAELERVAGLSAMSAKEEIFARAERETKLQVANLTRDIEAEGRRKAEYNAKLLIIEAIQRLAVDQTSESVIASVHLPSDEMKGRIIGREGRNIRAFEQLTGVNVMVDDSPETVLISCFEPMRREQARIALEDLVSDGRIYPARIEEAVERAGRKVKEEGMKAAEDALLTMGITDMAPDLIEHLAVLNYRTSYGQNVLAHSIESGKLAGVMAAELGLNQETIVRSAFLHDIGKSVSDSNGSHASIGAELARRAGEHPDVVHAIAAHHNEVEAHTVEDLLTQAADAMSGGRPGARRESLEAYVNRLTKLEEIASAHEGVEKAYSMQAGREVRVMVVPDKVSDSEAHTLAKDIAKEIEQGLAYPGNIKVTVVRESRATATAH
ncbi:MAG: ribonuclease Y [Propionibacteriaceae bacterium]|jgi:ribonuclease Y|nr:ribonuclease Y [Propionibacteriaceae bacterium]